MSNASSKEPTAVPFPLGDMTRQILKTVLGLTCLTAVVFGILRGEELLHSRAARALRRDDPATLVAEPELCGLRATSGLPIRVEMAASQDIRPWLEMAADQFSRLCPGIHLKMVPVDDFEAARSILAGQLRPALWAPTDELLLRYLAYARRSSTPAFDPANKTDLIESPLVLLLWEDRLKLLSFLLREQKGEEGLWVRGLCGLLPRDPNLSGTPIEAMTPGIWSDWYAEVVATPPRGRRRVKTVRPADDDELPPLPEVEGWGAIKLAHPWPTRNPAGLATLFLSSYQYVLPPRAQTTQDSEREPETGPKAFAEGLMTAKAPLRRWLRRCEAGLALPPLAERELTEMLFNRGPSYLDAVVTYEHLALPVLERVDANEQSLKRMAILYPTPTLVSRHPALLLDVEPEQREAAMRWVRFLRSRAMQELAIPLGLRPVNKEVSVRDFDSAHNRFLRLRRYGVQPEPHLIEAPLPNGQVLAELLAIWRDAIGRN